MPHAPRHDTSSRIFRSPMQAILIVALLLGPQSGARPARAAEPEAPPRLSKEELVALVAPIALYPDELLAIVLPGSTYPIQIVQASRYLEKRKSDPELKPSEDWDPSVLGLLNYPEVMAKLNDDLDWTWRLGDAVVNQQAEVMAAVQEFRAQVDLAGNLKSDDKMAVEKTVEDGKQVIVIESTSTEVIYVPTYQPSTVVVYSSAPYYYSPPYPYYYNPAATFWTGMFVGAAIAYGVGWGPHGGYGYYGGGNININNNINIDNSNNANIDRDRNNGAGGGNTKPWKPDERPGSTSGARPGGGTRPSASTRPTASTRPSTVPGTGAGSRPAAGSDPGAGTRPGASTRPAGETSRPTQGGTNPSLSDRSAQGKKYTYSSSGSRSSSVGDYQSGSQARHDSSRGMSSRSGGYGGSRGGGGGGGGRGRR